MSSSAKQQSTVGDIVNYMQIDTSRVENLAVSFHTLWDSTLQIGIYLTLLVQLLGPAAGVGFLSLFGLIPLNAYTFTVLAKFRKQGLFHTDARVRLINEVLNGIRIIKIQAWERNMGALLANLREAELGTVRASAVVRATLSSTLFVAPTVSWGGAAAALRVAVRPTFSPNS